MVQTDLFLTHDWGTDQQGRDNHKRVTVVNEQLKSLGYRTWFDSDRMVGDIAEQMASGIENTQAVVVFLTQRYMSKVNGDNPLDNCKLEFMHAVRRKTNNRMVCIVMEDRMKDTSTWDGSVGMFLAGKIYIDMSKDFKDKSYLRSQLSLLEKEIGGMNIFPNKNNVSEASNIPMAKLNISSKNDEDRAKQAKSTAWEPSFSIDFQNKHSRAVRIIWKDYKGEEKPIASPDELAPGATCGQSTYGTHPFIARDCQTNELLHFTNGKKTDVVAEGLAFGASKGQRIKLQVVSRK